MHEKIKTHSKRLLPYRYHLLVILTILLVSAIGTYALMRVFLKSNTQSFANPNKNNDKSAVLKYTDKRFEKYEAPGAQHYRKKAFKIENSDYGLGHCNLREAPSEKESTNAVEKKMDYPC